MNRNKFKGLGKIAAACAVLTVAAALICCRAESGPDTEKGTESGISSTSAEAEGTDGSKGTDDANGTDEARETDSGGETDSGAREESPAEISNDKQVAVYYMNYEYSEAERIESEYVSEWSEDEDLGVFAALHADEESIPFVTETELHRSTWGDDGDGYRIGYELSFDVEGEHKVITILKPRDIVDAPELFMGDVDTEEVTGYLGVWVYDDFHQDGFYVHVGEDEYDEDTLLTSIKLRPTSESYKIDNLRLKVFSYTDNLEFDSEGHYNNIYGYEIEIING